jgi:hypothetical protein
MNFLGKTPWYKKKYYPFNNSLFTMSHYYLSVGLHTQAKKKNLRALQRIENCVCVL